MYHTTGFDREEIIDICVRINSVERAANALKWPPCLGLFKSVTAALAYMRHNRTQVEIGESFGAGQLAQARHRDAGRTDRGGAVVILADLPRHRADGWIPAVEQGGPQLRNGIVKPDAEQPVGAIERQH